MRGPATRQRTALVLAGANSYLFRAHSAILVSAIAHHVPVRTGIPAEAGFAGRVEELERHQRGDPQYDAKASGNNPVCVARAYWASKRPLKSHSHDRSRREEVQCCDGEKYERRRKIRPGRPCHGQLAVTQIQRAVAAIYLQRVNQRADHGAAEDNYE